MLANALITANETCLQKKKKKNHNVQITHDITKLYDYNRASTPESTQTLTE